MLPDSSPSPQSQIQRIYQVYDALTSTLQLDAQTGLGGKLLYAGDIGGDGRDLLFAANIAGAASLAASADPLVQRQAIRDGVVDFLVTSLEEALRILKNEIRKRQAVSVLVAVGSSVLVEQMLDRGVLPDLLPPAGLRGETAGLEQAQLDRFVQDGAVQISWPELSELDEDRIDDERMFVTWSVDRESARWLPRLDVCVQELLPGEDLVRQRWLRLAARYLGRVMQRTHGVLLNSAEFLRLRNEARQLLAEHFGDAGGVPAIEIEGLPIR